MFEQVIGELREKLQQENIKTVIIPHISADGDAVGSTTALYGVLEKVGISTHLVTGDTFPDYLKWLKNADKAISFLHVPEECKRLIAQADLIFMLDHNSTKREGALTPFTLASAAKKVVIDHHPGPDAVDYLISDTGVSSTCELMYSVICGIWGREIIDEDIANSLYTGINTDTGGFSHNSSRPQTYRVVADLLELGLNKECVHERLYQTNTLSRLRLLGNALLNKLSIDPEYPLAIIPITLKELEAYDYKEGDLEGLVNIPLSIADVKVSIQVTQRKDKVKLSLRSKGNVPVNEWSKAYFNGGGHLNAAGGQMELPLNEVIDWINKSKQWFFENYGKL